MPGLRSILIVEDEPDILMVLKLQLLDAGYEVTATREPMDVYNLVTDKSFSLALVDINMPQVNGLEILAYIQKVSPDTPVVMMTAHGNEDLAVEAMKNGALDYFSKPFSTDDMLAKVERAITLSITARENREIKLALDAELAKLRELDSLRKSEEENSIVKSITFDEDAYQAGLSILSYFSTIVQQKYPQSKVKVRIEQEGRTVRLVIQTETGEKEEIEKTLEEYGQVVLGKVQPNELLADSLQVMQLEHKLEMARMELAHNRQMLDLTYSTFKQEIAGMKELIARSDLEIAGLKEQIGEALKREAESTHILAKIIDLYSINGQAKESVMQLSTLIEHGITERDKQIIFELLSIIKNQNPSAFDAIKAYFISSIGGATGNLLSTWLPALFAAMPK